MLGSTVLTADGLTHTGLLELDFINLEPRWHCHKLYNLMLLQTSQRRVADIIRSV